MSMLKQHTMETAPEKAKPLLQAAKDQMGFVPNLFGFMAEAPAALEAYLTLTKLYETTSLSPVEQQVVLLAASFENNCDYCMAAHSGLAKQAGMADEVLSAIRDGEPLPDDKLEALRRFTGKLVAQRGWLDEAGVREVLDAGYTQQQVLEVVLGVAMKTLSNYTNHLAGTPLDDAMKPLAWEKPQPARGTGSP